MWNALVQYTAKDSFNFTKVSSKEKELLTLRLKALLARYKWRNSGFYQVLNNEDPVVKKALEAIAK
jgi:carboxyl-terminal processing protease